MKKKMSMLCLVLVCLLVLAGCGCKHETWNEADCLNPKTCAECGETEGEALGHNWAEADCLNPKTCQSCGETEGEALGHNWAEATCAAPKTCQNCGETEGEALEHTWVDATTETPKTCEVCGTTEGDRIVTDDRFTTTEALPLMGSWYGELVMTGAMMEMPELEGDIPMNVVYTFGNAGEYLVDIEFTDWEGFLDIMSVYMTDMMYAEFEAMGMDKAAADATLKEFYGMTMEQLIATSLAELTQEDMDMSTEMVYYVQGGILYAAETWEDEMTEISYELKDGKLYIELEGYGTVELTPVAE